MNYYAFDALSKGDRFVQNDLVLICQCANCDRCYKNWTIVIDADASIAVMTLLAASDAAKVVHNIINILQKIESQDQTFHIFLRESLFFKLA